MKHFAKEFVHRGLLAAAGGPVILAIVYGILGNTGVIETLPAADVSTGILSVTLMAFIAAGITSVYQVEQLPLPSAIAIHAAVLYLDYLIMYLLNDWIPRSSGAISIFTGIFAAGFAIVWLCIWLINRSNVQRISKNLPSA